MANRLNFEIGFDISQSEVAKIKQSMQEIQKITQSDLFNNNKNLTFEQARKDLSEIQQAAMAVDAALIKAFNPKINTINIQKFQKEIQETVGSLSHLYDVFAKAGPAGHAGFQRMATTLLTTNQQMTQTKTILDSIGQTLGNTIKWNIASAAVNQLSGSVQEAYGYVKALDHSLNDIRIVTGKSAEDMDIFAEKANKAAKALGTSTTNYTKSALTFYQQGLNDKEVQARAELSNKVSNVTGLSGDQSAEYVTAVLNGYKVGSEEAEAAMDKLAAVAASTASDLAELSEGMSKVASAANAMGVTEDQLAATLSTVVSTTRQSASSVGTAFKTIYARIADIKAGTETAEVSLGEYSGKMAELGFNVLDSSGQLKDLGTVMEEIGGQWANLSREQQVSLAKTMAGTRQYNNLIALFDNWGDYMDALNVSMNSNGAIQEQQNIYMESTAAHLKQLKAANEDLFDSFLDADTINGTADAFGGFLKVLTNIVDVLGGGGNAVLAFGSIATQVFSKQIAKSLLDVEQKLNTNRKAVKNYQEDLQKAAEVQRVGKEKQDPIITNLGQKKQQLLNVKDYLSEEDYKTGDELLKQYSEAEIAKAAREEQIAHTKKLLGNINQADNTNYNTDFDLADADQREIVAKNVADAETKVTEAIKDQNQAYSKTLQFLEQIDNLEEGQGKTANKDNIDFADIQKKSENWVKNLQNLKTKMVDSGSNDQNSELYDGLIYQVENFQKAIAEMPADATKEQKAVLAKELKEIQQKYAQLADAIQADFKEAADATGKEAEEMAEQARLAAEKAEKELDELLGKPRSAVLTQQIVELAGAIGQMISGLSMLKNIGNILTNDNLSTGEKALQITEAIAAAIPMLIIGFNSMRTSLITLATSYGTAALATAGYEAATLTAAQATHFLSGTIIKKLIPTLLHLLTISWPYIATIALVSAGVYGLVKAWNADKEAAEDAAKTAEHTTKTYQELNSQIQQLQNTAIKYKDSIKAMEELDVSTKSYSESLKDANDSVLELVRNNSALAKYVEKEGDLWTFKATNEKGEEVTGEEALDIILQEANIQVENARIVMDMAEIDKNNKALESDKTDLIRLLNSKLYSEGTPGISQTSAQYQQAEQDASIFTEEQFNNVLQNVYDNHGKVIEDTLSNIEGLSSQQIKAIIDNKSAIEEYAQKKEENDLANDILRQDAVEAQLKQTGNYNVLNTRQQRVYRKSIFDNYSSEDEEEIRKEKEEEWNNKLDSEVHRAYEEFMQKTGQNIEYISNGTGVGKFLINGQEQSISDSLMRGVLVNNDVTNDIVKKVQSSDDQKGLDNFLRKIERMQYESKLDHAGALGLLEKTDAANADFKEGYKYRDAGDGWVKAKFDNIFEEIKNAEGEIVKYKAYKGDKDNDIQEGSEYTKQQLIDKLGSDWKLQDTTVDVGDLYGLKDIDEYVGSKFQQLGINPSDLMYQMLENNNNFNLNGVSDSTLAALKDKIENNKTGAADFFGVTRDDLKDAGLHTKDFLDGMSGAEAVKEWQKLKKDDADGLEDFYKRTGLTQEMFEDDIISKREAFTASFNRAVSEHEWDPEAALDRELQLSDKYNAGQLSEAGLDPGAVKEYAQYLMELDEKNHDAAESSEEVGASLKDNAEIALKTAKATMRMDKGIESLYDNFETWNDILHNSDESSQEYMHAINDLRTSTADLLDTEEDYVDNDFLLQHMTELEQAAQGDAAAIDKLHKELAVDMAVDFAIENGSEAISEDISAMVNNLDIPDLEIGATLDNADLETAMWDIVNTAKMTAEQAQAFYNQLGFEPNFEVEHQKVQQSVPVMTTTVKKISDDPLEYESRTWQSGSEMQDVTVDIPKFSADGTPPKLTSLGTGGFSPSHSASKPASARKGGGGEKASKPKKKDHIEDKVDKYHDINNELENLDRSLERLADAQDRLVGKELIDKLNEELHILEKQNDAYSEKIKLMKSEQKELQDKLINSGVAFDQDGYISNYNSVMQSQIDYVNGLIDQYNGMSVEEQEGFEETLEQAQKDFDKFKEDLERYDEIVVKDLPDLYDKIEENLSHQIEIQLEKFDMSIELKLDMAEAEREWNHFKRKVIDGIKDDDVIGNATQSYKDILSYYNTHNTGVGSIQAQTDRVNTILTEIQKMEKGGHSDIYSAYDKNTGIWVDDKKTAIEDLNESYKALMKDLESIQDLEEEVRQKFLESIDAVEDSFNAQRDSYRFLEDQLKHDIHLMELMYGDQAYAKMSEYYDKQIHSTKEMLAAEKRARDYWKEKMLAERDAVVNGTGDKEALEKYEENWKNAVSNVNSLIEQWGEQTIARYENIIDKMISDLNNKITNGLGLDYIEEELSLLDDNSKNYLDNINAAYAKQKLTNKWKDAINDTDSVYAQQKLNELMNAQLKMLEEKGKLTQHDIDRAEKEYEIALKQIALQEMQQNKSKMRLKRDTNGNYSYQFVSDEDSIRKAQDELAAAQNELYNFDKTAYQNNLNEMYAVWNEFQQKVAEAYKKYAGDEDALSEHIALLKEQYGEKINFLTEQNLSLRTNLSQSAFAELANMYQVDISEFQNMTQAEQDLILNELVPQWDSGVQQMIDKFASEDGFRGACQDTFDQLHDASQEYQEDMEDIRDQNQSASDEAIEQGNQLLEKSNQLIQSMIEENERVNDILESVKVLNQAYLDVKDSAIDATNAAYQYVQASRAVDAESERRFLEDERRKNQAMTNDIYRNNQIAASLNNINNALAGGSGSKGGHHHKNTGGSNSGYNAPIFNTGPGVFNGADVNMHKRYSPAHFNTGGYTGSWNSTQGKMAILHEKELVLNRTDTSNMLNAIDLLHNIVNSIGANALQTASNMLAHLGVTNVPTQQTADKVEQQVHIDAKFEGQTEADQITTALDNLVNIAAQRANRKK